MRTMVKGKQKLDISEFFILQNGWEYFAVNAPTNTDDIKLCLVDGFEMELGDVSISEIKPYIIARTKKLGEVMPARGWEWSN